jgi:hypothetical protein
MSYPSHLSGPRCQTAALHRRTAVPQIHWAGKNHRNAEHHDRAQRHASRRYRQYRERRQNAPHLSAYLDRQP